MLEFLSSFTSSFLLALVIWPFASAVLTLPILVAQYRRYNKLSAGRSIGIYLFIFYLLGLVCFTLYPLPENAAQFCQMYHLTPQLNPLQMLTDIQTDGLRAVLQVVMNLVFFVPLGVFMRLLFRLRFGWIIPASLVVSLFIETAQLTGGFGLYPCGYRLFDVDDLIINTLGGVIGYLLAMLMPQRQLETARHGDVIRQAGIVRNLVSFILDDTVVVGTTLFVLLTTYLLAGYDAAVLVRDIMPTVMVVVVFGLGPWLMRGWSIGSALVRLNHDDTTRRRWRRLLYYVLRTILVATILLLPSSWQWISLLTIVMTVIVWVKYHKLPHQLV